MPSFKRLLLTTTVLPVAAGFGIVAISLNAPAKAKQVNVQIAAACNPCAAKKACNPCNPCAAKKACNPCNPCAAKKACNPCNPCAAKKACNPCNPCAAKKACNPCNPCAAKKACNPCNPCAAGNPCNPCNPCAASAGLSNKCLIPSLASAAACNPCAAKKACNPCNPCAAKKACNPCNPCAAKNPCNPCAAKNPCNPCGASNPCNPCGASSIVEISDKEADMAYNCLKADIIAAYSKVNKPQIKNFTNWKIFNTSSYLAETHGGRYLNNYANATAAPVYGKFEDVTKMPAGSVLVKDGIAVNQSGQTGISPLFVMEKMKSGFNKATGDWRYTMIMPNGAVVGTTKGKGSKSVQFCADCHEAGADNDYLLFLPDEYRIGG